MALFSYQAFSKDGKKVRGTLDAATVEGAREQLTKMGLYPVSIDAALDEAGVGFFARIKSFFMRGVTSKEKILFTKQLAILLKSGVPLLQALELLIDQFEGRMRSILISLKDGIKEGRSLAEGLGRYPKIFPNIYIQLVKAGEASGKLELILDRLVSYLERRELMVKRVKSAMRYPMIQLGVVVLVVIALLTFVLPNLAETFAAQGAKLPWTTSFLMGLSAFITSYWYILIGLLILVVLLFRYWKSTPQGARLMDQIKLHIPIVKFFARTGAIVQFSQTLGMLMESGVNLSEALDIVVNIIDNQILADTLHEARDKIIKQGRIADFLKQTNIFPPIAIYLIQTGEQSGQLDAMLLTVAKNYEEELIEYSDTLSSLIDPIMLLVMGVVVGFVVMSVVQPILNQTELVNL
jgi:type II secretory pathway component PulF